MPKIVTKMKNEKIKYIRRIRGDGNWYYRAVWITYMNKII